MLITHRVLWADDEDKKETYVQYDVQDGVNLDQAIHDATIDFIIAGAVETELPGDLEYHHFIEYIDSQFCEKYGFTKTLLSDTAEVRDGHALCVSRHEFTHLLAERRAERQGKVARGYQSSNRRHAGGYHQIDGKNGYLLQSE